ncbi:MAG: 2-amino-4-hydroxy-6-hydroxymethyldihydropteridine diphosphokinase [Pirellulaceae bacterium]
MADVLIALGSNLGDKGESLLAAIEALRQTAGVSRLTSSTFHATAPVGGPEGQDDFLNAAVRLTTNLAPTEIHQRLIEIEQEQGRVRIQRWGARKLDLDLLLYDDRIIESRTLQVPHPRMSFRRFVLAPALEVAPEMRHPRLQCDLAKLYHILTTAPPLVEIAAAGDPLVETMAGEVATEVGYRSIWRSSYWLDFSTSHPWQRRAAELLELDRHQGIFPTAEETSPPSAGQIVPAWRLIAAACRKMVDPYQSADALMGPQATQVPRLTVCWEICYAEASSTCRAQMTAPQWQQYHEHLRDLVEASVHGPLLHLRGASADEAVVEIAAAIQAAS